MWNLQRLIEIAIKKGRYMYLLLNDKEKIIVDTVQELATRGLQLDEYKIYSLSPVESSELIDDGQIRDAICYVLKGNQMTKSELIETVNINIDVSKPKISKVITKMKRENVIYDAYDRNYLGERLIGML